MDKIEQIISEAREAFEALPVGKSGKRNGNALNALLFKYRAELEAVGAKYDYSRGAAIPCPIGLLWKHYKWGTK